MPFPYPEPMNQMTLKKMYPALAGVALSVTLASAQAAEPRKVDVLLIGGGLALFLLARRRGRSCPARPRR